jgi:hypothetical protein
VVHRQRRATTPPLPVGRVLLGAESAARALRDEAAKVDVVHRQRRVTTPPLPVGRVLRGPGCVLACRVENTGRTQHRHPVRRKRQFMVLCVLGSAVPASPSWPTALAEVERCVTGHFCPHASWQAERKMTSRWPYTCTSSRRNRAGIYPVEYRVVCAREGQWGNARAQLTKTGSS